MFIVSAEYDEEGLFAYFTILFIFAGASRGWLRTMHVSQRVVEGVACGYSCCCLSTLFNFPVHSFILTQLLKYFPLFFFFSFCSMCGFITHMTQHVSYFHDSTYNKLQCIYHEVQHMSQLCSSNRLLCDSLYVWKTLGPHDICCTVFRLHHIVLLI